jgi:D-glycero-D-manno-heptose 1,7-bisphosphate phosphatase
MADRRTADRLTPAAFIDRDGVINRELEYVHRVEDFHVLPGVVQALTLFQAAGFDLVVVTNQAGIAHGLYSEADFDHLTAHMLATFAAQGVHIGGVYHCPHHPNGRVPAYAVDCACRKPKPGMLLAAAADLHLDLPRSLMVGDKPSDVQAGRAAGVGLTALVRSGHALPEEAELHADFVCDDLFDAAQRMLERKRKTADSNGSWWW